MNYNNTRNPIILMAVLGIIWGTGFSIAKYVIGSGFSPLLYLFLNLACPVIFLGILTYGKAKIFAEIYKNARFFVIIALTGILLPDLNRYLITKYLASGIVGILTNTVPLFIYPMSLIVGEEKFKAWRLFGILIGVCGILLVVSNGDAYFWHIGSNKFALLNLFTPFCYAFCSVYIVKKRPESCSSTTICFGMMLLSMVAVLPLVLFYSPEFSIHVGSNKVLPILLLGIVLSTIGYVLLFEILRKSGSVCYSVTDGIVATTSLLCGSLFLQEKLTIYSICGMLCIFTGWMLVLRSAVRSACVSRTLLDISHGER